MENLKFIDKCMKMQCDFCRRKPKCDKEIELYCVVKNNKKINLGGNYESKSNKQV